MLQIQRVHLHQEYCEEIRRSEGGIGHNTPLPELPNNRTSIYYTSTPGGA